MNKILFRGFHPDENGKTTITFNGEKIKGEWVYGLLPFRNKIRVFTTHKWNDEGEEREYDTTEDLSVLPETVGQWVTNDKKGRDIFEGDVVKSYIDDEVPCGIIKYEDACFYVDIRNGYDAMAIEEYEPIVIDNIWEAEE